ncbi:hypothetical protein C1N87_31005 (plasmid) [Priestia aryabhattai]
MIPAIIEFVFIIGIIFLISTAIYSGVFFFISKVSFLGIYTDSYHDTFLFILVLNLFVYLTSILVGIIYVALNKKYNLPQPNKFALVLFSFLVPLVFWHITDLLFSTISIPYWVLVIFSIIMAIFNANNFKAHLKNSNESNQD